MKNLTRLGLLLLLALMFTLSAGAPAQADYRRADGTYVWQVPGTNPRLKGGIKNLAEFCVWFLGAGMQNDLIRLGLSPDGRNLMYELVKLVSEGKLKLGQVHKFGAGWTGVVKYLRVPKGTRYEAMTYSQPGAAVQQVETAFDAVAWRTVLTDPAGVQVKVDLVVDCANAARMNTVVTVTPPERPQPLPEVTPEPEVGGGPYYRPVGGASLVPKPATVVTERHEGHLAAILGFLGRVFQAVPTFKVANVLNNGSSSVSASDAFAGAFSSSTSTATGGSVQTGPTTITVPVQNINNNTNILDD